MGVTFYGEYIKRIRETAGLSMEKAAEGICSIQTLYRAENNKAGLSPLVFQGIISRCGGSLKVFPEFANWADFECYYELSRVELWAKAWQVDRAYKCLEKIKNLNFADNRLHYQKYLYYAAYLMNRNASKEYLVIGGTLEKALRITKPYIDLRNIEDALFNDIELRIIASIAENMLMLDKNNAKTVSAICESIIEYIKTSPFSELDRIKLLIRIKKPLVLSLLLLKEYQEALNVAADIRQKTLEVAEDEHLIEVTFLFGLSEFLTDNEDVGIHYMRAAVFSSDAVKAQFVRKAMHLLNWLDIKSPEVEEALEYCPSLKEYEGPNLSAELPKDTNEVLEDSEEIVTYGKIIRRRRKEQKLSAKALSNGLCTESALSKIENDKVTPDLFLARALLQRLGMSDEPFMFFASKAEEDMYVLEREFVGVERHFREKIPEYLEKMKKMAEIANNRLFLQKINGDIIFHGKGASKSERLLKNLRETLRDFNMVRVLEYRLSNDEISDAFAYCQTVREDASVAQSTKYLYCIYEYVKQKFLDDFYLRNMKPMIVSCLINTLGVQDRYDEIMELMPVIQDEFNHLDIHEMSVMYAHVSEICARRSNAYSLKEYALYAYYLFSLEDSRFEKRFINNIREITGADITYCY